MASPAQARSRPGRRRAHVDIIDRRSPVGGGDTERFFRGALSTMVAPGATDTRSARVMARTRRAGEHVMVLRSSASDAERHEVRAHFGVDELRRSDGTFSLRYPDDTAGGALQPNTEYTLFIEHVPSGARLGEGRLRTAPVPGSEAGARVTLGVASCHNPFRSDGALHPDALRALVSAERAYDDVGAGRIVLAGDQVYGDMPPELSLFDPDHFAQVGPRYRGSIFECTEDEVRALYQERHRVFWKVDAMRSLMARFACHPILDDHEIIDNFGSLPEHSTPRWSRVRAGAFAAFHDYQARRVFGDVRPASFDHGFRYGDLAVYVADLRSERFATDDELVMLSRAQLRRLAAFLDRHGDAAASVLVLSVPLLHLPDWMIGAQVGISGEGSDAGDRWSAPKARPSRDALVELLKRHERRHPHQRLVLAGGDIHVGAAMELRFTEQSRPALQLVSSALSNAQGRVDELMAGAMARAVSTRGHETKTFARASMLEGVDGADRNPCARLNFGVIDLDARGDDAAVRVRLLSPDEEVVPTAVPVFDSGWR